MGTTATSGDTAGSRLGSLVGVVARGQTYRNLLYLLLAFPLGLVYAVLLTTGFALGVGLLVTLVGVPVLLGTVLLARAFGSLERQLADSFLGREVPPREDVADVSGLVARSKALVLARSTWLAVAYCYLKVALGIASFAIVVVGAGLTVGFVTAPLTYADPDVGITVGLWAVDTFVEALAVVPLGLVAFVAWLHLVNVVAELSADVAEGLLGP